MFVVGTITLASVFLFIALIFQPCITFKYPTKIYKFGRVGKILKSGIIE